MGWLSIFSFLGCGGKPTVEIKTVQHGPFTIQMETHHNKYFNMNVGRRVMHSYLRYQILYNNKSIDFPEALQTNTGYPHLWRVYILSGAPTPTLIGGSQSLYLIKEKDGGVEITPIIEQGYDFASLQMLDSENGQPAGSSQVYMGDPGDGVDTIGGGDFLLVSQHAVLHIPDLTIYPFNVNNLSIDEYYFMGNHRGAIAFSPDKKWIVFDGNITYWDNDKNKVVSHYAMIPYNYRDDKGYALPFDHTKTRMRDPNYITHEWFNTYFEWKQGTDGEYRLQLSQFERLPYWQGEFVDEDNVYSLAPVSLDMQQAFADFILNQLNLSKENILPGSEYSTNEINIAYGELIFALWYQQEENNLVFMKNIYDPDNEQYNKIIHQVGQAFNTELSKGKYQQLFTSF
jgi:hypothetical protein